MHEINLLEIYYGVYRDESKELAEQAYVKVLNLPIKVVKGLRKNVFKKAGSKLVDNNGDLKIRLLISSCILSAMRKTMEELRMISVPQEMTNH